MMTKKPAAAPRPRARENALAANLGGRRLWAAVVGGERDSLLLFCERSQGEEHLLQSRYTTYAHYDVQMQYRGRGR